MRYTYNKPNRSNDQLNSEIAALNLPGYERLLDSGDTVILEFTDELSPVNVAILDAAVAAHVPDPAWALQRLRQETIETFLNDQSAVARVLRALAITVMQKTNAISGNVCPVVGQVQAVWDPVSIANGAGLTSPVLAVPGAALGDLVEVSIPVSAAGLIVQGFVSAANSVQVRLHNGTGGAVNLPSGTWGVRVRRPITMEPDDANDLLQAVVANINAG